MPGENPFLDSIWPVLCQDPKLFGHAMCGPETADPEQAIKALQLELDNIDKSFEVVESVTEFSDHYHKIEELRGKIGLIQSGLSKLETYGNVYQDATSLVKAIRRIRAIGQNPDPIVAARAWGDALTSFGNLVELLPPPASSVGTIIAETGKVFAKVVADMQPQVHMKERSGGTAPGVREIIHNL